MNHEEFRHAHGSLNPELPWPVCPSGVRAADGVLYSVELQFLGQVSGTMCPGPNFVAALIQTYRCPVCENLIVLDARTNFVIDDSRYAVREKGKQ